MSATSEPSTAVRANEDSRTCAPDSRAQMAPNRVASRALASRMLATCVAAHSSMRAYADSLGVTLTSVRDFCDPDAAAAITLGDLLAGRRSVARAVLVSCLAVLDERDVHAATDPIAGVLRLAADVLRLAADVGRLSDLTLEAAGRSLAPSERARLVVELDAIGSRLSQIRRFAVAEQT